MFYHVLVGIFVVLLWFRPAFVSGASNVRNTLRSGL